MVFTERPIRGSKIITRLIISTCSKLVLLSLVIVALGSFLEATGQSLQSNQNVSKPESSAKPAAKTKYKLRVVKEDVIGVSLKAEKARLSEVAADLSKQLGVRVVLGRSMEKEAITVEFMDLTLETALRLLAPHVYVDYEIRANAQPSPLGIFLLGDSDPEPAKNAVVEASSQAILIEGNTEDTEEKTEADPDDPLQVELDKDQLTIKSKKQPLVVVILEIADLLGVPAEIKYESSEIISTEIKGVPFEDAIPRLSANVRLYVRVDLTRSQTTALRLAIVQPAIKAIVQ